MFIGGYKQDGTKEKIKPWVFICVGIIFFIVFLVLVFCN